MDILNLNKKRRFMNNRIILLIVIIFSFIGFQTIHINSIKTKTETSIKIKESKMNLIGKRAESGLREDIDSWIRDQKILKEHKNALINIAISDQEIFNVYDNKDSANGLHSKQAERYRCFSYQFKGKERENFITLIGNLRMIIFNNENRVNAFHAFNRIKGESTLNINNINQEEICNKFFQNIIPIN